jgi:peptide/nickel transport system substrate-binding protein
MKKVVSLIGILAIAGLLAAACASSTEEAAEQPSVAPTVAAAVATTAPATTPTTGPAAGPPVTAKATAAPVTAKATVAPEGGPKRGGTLHVLTTPPPNLDSARTCNIFAMTVGYHMWDTLFATDSRGDMHPQLADQWEQSPDGLSLTVSLRPGLLFHDGEPVTSKDVVASLQRWSELDAIGKLMAERLTNLTALDSQTIELELNEALGPLIYGLGKAGCRMAQILPKSLIDDLPDTVGLPYYTGSGAYQFVEWVPDRNILLERFEDYVPRSEPADGWAGGHIAYTDQISFEFIPQAATAIAALKAGELDFADLTALDEAAELGKDTENYTVYVSSPGHLTVTGVNMTPNSLLGRNPMGDMLRRAIWTGLDPEAISAAIGPSQFWTAHHYLFYEGTIWSSDAGKELWADHGNVEKAKRLIAESGYKGEPIKQLRANTPGAFSNIQVALTEQLRTLGLNVETRDLDTAARQAIRRDLTTYTHDLYPFGFNSLTSGYPITNLPIDLSFYSYRSDDMAEVKQKFASAVTYEEQKRLADEMQRLYHKDLPMFHYGEMLRPRVVRSWAKGFLNTQVLSVYWNVWLDR